jgi:hypothetical protein
MWWNMVYNETPLRICKKKIKNIVLNQNRRKTSGFTKTEYCNVVTVTVQFSSITANHGCNPENKSVRAIRHAVPS